MDFSFARQQFYQEIQQPDASIDLAKAALFLAQEEYPHLDPDAYLQALDTMAATVAARLPAERYPLRVLQTINHHLYEELGVRGNTEDYYDPRNSYLNEVIDRRLGIPITLSLVYLQVAQRIDFPMIGVGMPGHFLIRPTLDEMEILVDPFHRGEVMFAADCQDRLSQLYGRPIALRPEFLQPVTHRQFLARMLTNLKFIYSNQGSFARVLAAIERILLLFPDAPLEHRDRGLLYYQTGRWTEAREDLEHYLNSAPTAEDADAVRRLLKRMQSESS
jgi:regulator of sirC expression with transglutaminase-like and TPR domain